MLHPLLRWRSSEGDARLVQAIEVTSKAEIIAESRWAWDEARIGRKLTREDIKEDRLPSCQTKCKHFLSSNRVSRPLAPRMKASAGEVE